MCVTNSNSDTDLFKKIKLKSFRTFYKFTIYFCLFIASELSDFLKTTSVTCVNIGRKTFIMIRQSCFPQEVISEEIYSCGIISSKRPG